MKIYMEKYHSNKVGMYIAQNACSYNKYQSDVGRQQQPNIIKMSTMLHCCWTNSISRVPLTQTTSTVNMAIRLRPQSWYGNHTVLLQQWSFHRSYGLPSIQPISIKDTGKHLTVRLHRYGSIKSMVYHNNAAKSMHFFSAKLDSAKHTYVNNLPRTITQ